MIRDFSIMLVSSVPKFIGNHGNDETDVLCNWLRSDSEPCIVSEPYPLVVFGENLSSLRKIALTERKSVMRLSPFKRRRGDKVKLTFGCPTAPARDWNSGEHQEGALQLLPPSLQSRGCRFSRPSSPPGDLEHRNVY